MEQETILIEEPKRPAFLNVLCILTFIGVGLMLLGSLIGIYNTFLQSDEQKEAKRQEQYEQMQQFKPEAADTMLQAQEEAAPYEKPNWIIGFGCNLFTLLGAIMMFRLKKIGFYIYTAAELLPYFLQFLFAGGSKGMKIGMSIASSWIPEGAVIAFMVLFILFDLGFIVMYGLNLKHMK